MRKFLAAGLFLLLLPACSSKSSGKSNIDQVTVDETVTIPNLTAPVDVVRDEWGRPHVYAANQADLARVTGWVHAEDRFIQMDVQRRFAEGKIAELVGALAPDQVQADEELRAIGLGRAAQKTYDALSANDKALLDAYAEGVNAKLATFTSAPPVPDYNAFSYPFASTPPWTGVDSLAVGRLLAFDLSWDGDQDIAFNQILEDYDAAFPPGDPREGAIDDMVLRLKPPVLIPIVDPTLPPPTDVYQRPSWTAHAPKASLAAAHAVTRTIFEDPFNFLYTPARGSNNWVVGPGRTKSGHALLCNDPHLGLSAPPIWYELHLNTARAGGNIDEIGVSLPGVPSIIIGANGKLAWGVTNTGPDVTDTYVEHVVTDSAGNLSAMWDPDGPGGATPPSLYPLTRDDEVIEVRNSATSTTPVTETVWRIPYRNNGDAVIVPGSIVNGTALSWAWTGMGPTNELRTLQNLATATSAADLQTAVNDWEVPAQNFVYADTQGNFGYVANGWYPIRGDDDGNLHTDPPYMIVPGYDGGHEWTGRIARTDVPQEANPTRGWAASSNQDPFGDTFDGDPVNDAFYIGAGFDDGFRALEIATVLDSKPKATVADMKALQSDHTSNLGKRFLPFLLTALGTTHANEAALLQGWADRGFQAESGVGNSVPATVVDDAAATSLFNAWLVSLKNRTLGDEESKSSYHMPDQVEIRTLLLMLEHPTEAATYDPGSGESVLWDDLTTTGTVETKDQIMTSAFDDALAFLASPQGFGSTDPTDWRWGLLHRLVMGRLTGLASYDIPNPADPQYPTGFPRHSDLLNVDVGNFGLDDYDFTYGGGASQRWIVDLDPSGMTLYNSLPGGVSSNPDDPHYADQALDYANDVWHSTWYREKDVASHGKHHSRFTP